jgi:hypothetical protein
VLRLPFAPRKHKSLLSKNFSDEEDQIDLNALNEEQGIIQNRPDPNAINVNQNWLALLINSLFPWNHLPNNNLPPEDHQDFD